MQGIFGKLKKRWHKDPCVWRERCFRGPIQLTVSIPKPADKMQAKVSEMKYVRQPFGFKALTDQGCCLARLGNPSPWSASAPGWRNPIQLLVV